jgi:hypothetical protein
MIKIKDIKDLDSQEIDEDEEINKLSREKFEKEIIQQQEKKIDESRDSEILKQIEYRPLRMVIWQYKNTGKISNYTIQKRYKNREGEWITQQLNIYPSEMNLLKLILVEHVMEEKKL